MATTSVVECTEGDAERWDAFVEAAPEAAFFHRFGWRGVFEQALKHRTVYLLAERAGAVAGVLPLVHVKSFLFGNSLSSLAFCSDAGPLAVDPEARKALTRAALERADALGVDALEYRLRRPSGEARVTKDLYETFSKPLDPDPDANMKAIRSKQRNVIRKGIKNGLTSRVATLDEFYPVYAESVRNLGTPVFPRALFSTIAVTFPSDVEYLVVEHEGQGVASSMNFYHSDSVCPYFWGGTWAARRLNGNDFLAWEIMCRAADRGCRVFDFGRSKKDTGSRQWKVNLGFEASPLYYEYDLVRASEMPDINPLNPKYRLFIEAWKRLPLPVAGILGPWLSRNLG